LLVENTCPSSIDITLCQDEFGAFGACGVKAREGSDAGLYPEPDTFTLSGEGTERVISLNTPGIPGAYSINVRAKLSNKPELHANVRRIPVEVDGMLFEKETPFITVTPKNNDSNNNEFIIRTININNRKIGIDGPLSVTSSFIQTGAFSRQTNKRDFNWWSQAPKLSNDYPIASGTQLCENRGRGEICRTINGGIDAVGDLLNGVLVDPNYSMPQELIGPENESLASVNLSG